MSSNSEPDVSYVVSVVRALVNSVKPPCILKNILREYFETEGQSLPYQRLGYKSPVDFLKSTNEFSLDTFAGDVTIRAKPNARTAHITSMISQQKAKKRAKASKPPRMMNSYGNCNRSKRTALKPINSQKPYQDHYQQQQQQQQQQRQQQRQREQQQQQQQQLQHQKQQQQQHQKQTLVQRQQQLQKKLREEQQQQQQREKEKLEELQYQRRMEQQRQQQQEKQQQQQQQELLQQKQRQQQHQQQHQQHQQKHQQQPHPILGRSSQPNRDVAEVPRRTSSLQDRLNVKAKCPEKSQTEAPAKPSGRHHAEKPKEQKELKVVFPDEDVEAIDFVLKLYQEIAHHPHGVFKNKVEEIYKACYRLNPPKNWQKLVEHSRLFAIESYADKAIVFAHPTTTDEIPLPWENTFWELIITHTECTTEVWARLFGEDYNKQYEELSVEMDEYREVHRDEGPVDVVVNNAVYLVRSSDSWLRVRTDEIDLANERAVCTYIDYGDYEWIDLKQLFFCPAEFLALPGQAVCFSLSGLEHFRDNRFADKLLNETLVNHSVVARVQSTRRDYESSDVGETVPKVSVMLFDTSTNEDIDLNKYLLITICKNLKAPTLKSIGTNNTTITYINDNGEIYFNVINEEFKYFASCMDEIFSSGAHFESLQTCVRSVNLLTTAYAVRISDHNDSSSSDNNNNNSSSSDKVTLTMPQPKWYRGIAMKEQRSGELLMYLIDRGNYINVNKSDLFDLRYISAVLELYPPQVVKASLHKVPALTTKTSSLLRRLLPLDENALIKLNCSDGTHLKVTVYKRLKEQNIICNVNDALLLEEEVDSSIRKHR